MKLTKLLIFCFLSVLFSVYGQAQYVSIKGKIIEENGLPIPGVSILIKGTSKATVSDMDGSYQLKADSNGTLVFNSCPLILLIIMPFLRVCVSVSLMKSSFWHLKNSNILQYVIILKSVLCIN